MTYLTEDNIYVLYYWDKKNGVVEPGCKQKMTDEQTVDTSTVYLDKDTPVLPW